MLLCQLPKVYHNHFLAKMHEKCYLGGLGDVTGSYVRILDEKGIADLVIEVVIPELEVAFSKPTYQRQHERKTGSHRVPAAECSRAP